jgi:class 3 adenylate cyclase
MLFADVKGYSRLSGHQLYDFARRFMDACAEVIRHHDDGVFSTRTQGDSLFVVFRDLASAVETARELRDMIGSTNWEQSGLPAELSARLALDCGPCYDYLDPVTGRTELCGAHVIRAARLEPVTPPGHIYASESFATLCAVKKIDACFEAAGRIVLPKSYGEMRVYHLR